MIYILQQWLVVKSIPYEFSIKDEEKWLYIMKINYIYLGSITKIYVFLLPKYKSLLIYPGWWHHIINKKMLISHPKVSKYWHQYWNSDVKIRSINIDSKNKSIWDSSDRICNLKHQDCIWNRSDRRCNWKQWDWNLIMIEIWMWYNKKTIYYLKKNLLNLSYRKR